MNYIYNLDGKLDSQETAQLQALQTQVANAKDPELSDSTPQEELPLGMPAVYMRESCRATCQRKRQKSLAMPLLVLQGGRDYQVSPTLDFESLKAGLGRKSQCHLQALPGAEPRVHRRAGRLPPPPSTRFEGMSTRRSSPILPPGSKGNKNKRGL